MDIAKPLKIDILIQKLNEDSNCVSYTRKSVFIYKLMLGFMLRFS